MKFWLLAIVAVLMLISCGAWKHGAHFSYTEYRLTEFQQKMESTRDYLIVDVRTPSEYRKGHMKNAINISYLSGEFAKYVDTLPKSKPVFIYCQTQHRSPFAAKVMRKKGFSQVIDLTGGFMKWENGNFPIEK